MTQNTILFADIAGSTALFERLGDSTAEFIVNDMLGKLRTIVIQQKGEVIKTIGDEILCLFPTSENAIQAANLMHEFTHKTTVPELGENISIRIGAHEGEVIESQGDVYGDTVNVAARITAFARPGKTMISKQTYDTLPGYMKQFCSHVLQKQLKGKSEAVDMYNVIWEENEESTRVLEIPRIHSFDGKLMLKYQDKEMEFSKGILSIGRGKKCDFIVESPQSSRHHCEIHRTNTGFTLNDNSTNGLYLKQNNHEVFLHHNSSPLNLEGSISLGESSSAGEEHLIHFIVESD